MKKLHVDLSHCYGIKRLTADFDFSKCRAYAIYAPNGAMKSSLAQVFKDVADGTPSKDRIFPARPTSRDIVDETGRSIDQDAVLVIGPYNEELGHTAKTSTLLVNAKLRAEYAQLHAEIVALETSFCEALKKQSGSKRDIAKEVSRTFTKGEDQFRMALRRVDAEVQAQPSTPFADVPYDVIFDDKALAFIGQKDFKTAIADYVAQYNKLLSLSTYFRQGVFTYYNAATIAKSLADNGFFDAKHTVNLNAAERLEITNQRQLEELITNERDKITNDKDLRKKFAEIEKAANKNANSREFMAHMERNVGLLPEMANIEAFREKVWKSYFTVLIDQYNALVKKYAEVEQREKEIKAEAAAERTQWETVIDIFNERFFVPFKLSAMNRISVILGTEPMLTLGFTFTEGTDEASVERATLMQALSMGERKALYILNVIFEIEARKKSQQDTLIIVDDIADSFDYKNKYAIIQYLKDVAEEAKFNQIILTHNFDFFRTVNSRFVDYGNCLMAFKDSNGLTLGKAAGIKNVFVKDWKVKFFIDQRKRLASIPFIRNLVEYTSGESDSRFATLTSLLHWKPDSASILQRDLDAIYNSTFNANGKCIDEAMPVVDVIEREAEACLKAGTSANFENKIVLSIAIRLAAEKYMCVKIADSAFVAGIRANQTAALYGRFKADYPNDTHANSTLQRVILMTPENIHLNSFMYEPILDMSDEHLRKLYQNTLDLT